LPPEVVRGLGASGISEEHAACGGIKGGSAHTVYRTGEVHGAITEPGHTASNLSRCMARTEERLLSRHIHRRLIEIRSALAAFET
jgi:hypothetical protein